jgi:hypothetical protein
MVGSAYVGVTADPAEDEEHAMSAYLCDQDTINAIATFAADHKLVEDPKLFADLLTLQNVASMKARYPGRDWLKAEVIDVAAGYVYEPVPADARRIVDLTEEYDYQACETDGYAGSLCSRLVIRTGQHASAIVALERKAGCGAARLPSNIERAANPSTNKAYVGYGRGLVWRIRKSGTGGWEAFEINGNPQYERSATLALLSEKIGRPDEISGRSEPDAGSLNDAHAAGAAYWQHHRMLPGTGSIPIANLAGVARSCGWHGADCEAWLTGFDDARRDTLLAERDEAWRRK